MVAPWAGAQEVQEVRLSPLVAPPAAMEEQVAWKASEETAARFTVDCPEAGLLTFVVLSNDKDDVAFSVTDGNGVIRPEGKIDGDPATLPGGEFGAVLVPAGPSGVAVISNEGTQRGHLRLSFIALDDLPVAADPSTRYERAPVLVPDVPMEDRVLPLNEAANENDGESRRVFYFKPETDGPCTLNYTSEDEGSIFIMVYPAASMWEPVWEYDEGDGVYQFEAEAGAGYFVVVDCRGYDESVPFTITLESRVMPGVAVRRAPR